MDLKIWGGGSNHWKSLGKPNWIQPIQKDTGIEKMVWTSALNNGWGETIKNCFLKIGKILTMIKFTKFNKTIWVFSDNCMSNRTNFILYENLYLNC